MLLNDEIMLTGSATEATAVPDELAMTLRKPIKLGELEYATLDLTEPTVAQLRKAGKAGDAIDQLATLIHLNAKVPMTVVDQISQRDMEDAARFFMRFGLKRP